MEVTKWQAGISVSATPDEALALLRPGGLLRKYAVAITEVRWAKSGALIYLSKEAWKDLLSSDPEHHCDYALLRLLTAVTELPEPPRRAA